MVIQKVRIMMNKSNLDNRNNDKPEKNSYMGIQKVRTIVNKSNTSMGIQKVPQIVCVHVFYAIVCVSLGEQAMEMRFFVL